MSSDVIVITILCAITITSMLGSWRDMKKAAEAEARAKEVEDENIRIRVLARHAGATTAPTEANLRRWIEAMLPAGLKLEYHRDYRRDVKPGILRVEVATHLPDTVGNDDGSVDASSHPGFQP